MEDLPLFPDLGLEVDEDDLDLTDLDMSGLDRVTLASASVPQVSYDSSLGSLDGNFGGAFVDLNSQYPLVIKVKADVKDDKNGNGKKNTVTTVFPRSSKENERSKKRLPEAKTFAMEDRDTNSDTESMSSSNVLQRKNDGNLSKNAIAARENRLKKKKYIEELEGSNKRLLTENTNLKNRVQKQDAAIQNLETHNAYLQGVLANVKEISALLRNVKNTPGVKFTSSLNAGAAKRKRGVDHEYCSTPMNKKRRSQPSTSSTEDSGTESVKMEDHPVGVCLHVAAGRVSLEFCPRCSDSVANLLQQEVEESGDDGDS